MIVVHFRYHKMVSKSITKGNKPEIQVAGIEKAAEGIMKSEKKLR